MKPELQKLNKKNIEELFHANYRRLCVMAVRYVDDIEVAKDLVQGLFAHLLYKYEQIQLKTSLEAYAVRSVKHLCITYLRRQKSQKIVYQTDDLPEMTFDPYGLIDDQNQRLEMYAKLHAALKKLPPERCKIFLMSNVEGFSYAEIAEKNGISVNTVKTQIKKAYSTLRAELSVNAIVCLILFFRINDL
ncbi:sigma-70 family RNA polymerase sigma factor [Solitalea sp. MAHUQ-68]|uniref:Sigma-70 family RNA polymerase sigma factor n=1 Tax=Solitalea agri TaxID=2953739 RepID=A0A9X2F4H2_9SPHI|nr:sigma-70 family RNA polymerase sigma factor [Solitalea agri]MCO4294049.1 sigma-70 family RNA polymerase sigma factor [Solitalea agri]